MKNKKRVLYGPPICNELIDIAQKEIIEDDLCEYQNTINCNEFDCPNKNKVCPNVRIFNKEEKDFTCNNCSDKEWCEYAYDSYCTGGDCLAIK
jgi:hypothetical protein